MNSLEIKIKEVVTPIIESEGSEFVDIEIKGKPGNQTIKIYVDSENGIKLDQCTNISRLISEQFDILDIIPNKYRLEVSSPGVSRLLETVRDFKRNENKDVELTYMEAAEVSRFSGILSKVSDEMIEIKGENEVKSIPFSKIKHGKLILPW